MAYDTNTGGVTSTGILQALSDLVAQGRAPGGPVVEPATLVTVAGAVDLFPANALRRLLQVVNTSDTVQVVRYGATASATAGIPLKSGESITLDDRFVPTGRISLWCAAAGKSFYAVEG